MLSKNKNNPDDKNKDQEESNNKKDQQQKQKAQQQEQQQISGNELLFIKKSGYFSDLDRQTALQKHLKNVKLNGFLGFGEQDMETYKTEMKERKEKSKKDNFERIEEQQIKKSAEDYKTLTKFDGLAIEQKLNIFERTERNILEQELLWDESGDQFFKINGDLIIDDDFYDKKISKVLTVTFEANPACQVYRRNAIMCERLNQNKHVGFKLNIYIGKVTLYKHPLQDEEENIMRELREDMREYRKRVELALIPHCSRIENLIDKEHSELIKQANKPEKEIQILLNEKKRVTEIKQEEIEFMKKLMSQISSKWRDIENRRNDAKGKRNFLTTQYQLNVKQYDTDEKTKEIELGLGKIVDQERLKDVTNFPSEMARRQKIKKDQFYVILLINNKEVAATQLSNVEWPNYECSFMEKFQVLLYTKPSSIKLKVYKNKFPFDLLVDTVELEIPGEKTRTKTSSNRLLKEVEFSQGMEARHTKRMKLREKDAKREEEERKKRQKIIRDQLEQQKKDQEEKEQQQQDNNNKKGEDKEDENNQNKNDNKENEGEGEEDLEKKQQEQEDIQNNLLEQQERAEQQEQEKKQERQQLDIIEEQKARKAAQYEGKVSFMAEWEGNGPNMPPNNIDNFGKGKIVYDDELIMSLGGQDEDEALIKKQINMDQEGYHFDVNDPRNKEQIDKLQLQKNVDQEEGVKKDIMMPYQDIVSLRQELIKLRQVNPDIEKVPVSEELCFRNNDLMNKLAESKQSQNDILLLQKQQIDKKRKQVLTIDNAFIAAEDVCTDNPNTKQRVAEIIKTLKNRQREQKRKKVKNSVAVGQITLRTIVNEFRFQEKQQQLIDWVKGLCTQKRKLAPPKIKTNKVQLSQVSQIKIQIYISHGRNIPVRNEDSEDRHNQSNINQYQHNLRAAPNYASTNVQGYPPQGNYRNNQMQQFGLNQGYQGPQGQFNNTGQMQGSNIYGNTGRGPFDPPGGVMQRKKPTVQSYIDMKLRIPDYKDKRYDLSSQQAKSKYYSGSNPDWNSEAEVVYKSKKLMQDNDGVEPEDHEPYAFKLYEIMNPQNQLYITLFEHKAKLMKVYTNKNQVTIHVDNYFLGNMVIPLSQLLRNPQQSATFRINRPLVLYGYNLDMNLPYGEQNEKQIKFVSPRTPTTVTMSLTTEPQLDIPDEQDLEYFGTQEDSDLLYSAKAYLEELKRDKIKSKRHIRLWAQDLKNNSYFLPRFIHPEGLNPPIDIKDSSAIERAARYVALIPFKLENDNFKDVPDSFMDCQQFLDIKGGDFEEHACLLCNYFIYIDKKLGGNHAHYKSFIVLGKAVPEGETFYVVRLSTRPEDKGCIEIWNPQTGDPFVLKNQEFVSPSLCCLSVGGGKQTIIDDNDKACPLQEIGCIFDNTGVYINLQKDGAPDQVDWDILNKKKWQQYPDEKKMAKIFGQTIPTLQCDRLEYDHTEDEKVNQLELSIQSYIKAQIEEQRSEHNQGVQFQSRFRRDISAKIREHVVASLENIRFTSRLSGLSSSLSVSKQDQLKAASDLEKICKNLEKEADNTDRQLYGFPINFTFTEYDKIWQEIEATGIAEILRNDFDYILSVYCAKYPSYIISVWVFIGVLFDEKSDY